MKAGKGLIFQYDFFLFVVINGIGSRMTITLNWISRRKIDGWMDGIKYNQKSKEGRLKSCCHRSWEQVPPGNSLGIEEMVTMFLGPLFKKEEGICSETYSAEYNPTMN